MRKEASQKSLRVDYSKCTGCHLCEIACSLFNEGVCNPAVSYICVVTWEEALDFPMVCQQCDDAPCAEVCPVDAITLDNRTGAWVVDVEECIGCAACEDACPYDTIFVDDELGIALKCDLCNGAPECAASCPMGAIITNASEAEASGS